MNARTFASLFALCKYFQNFFRYVLDGTPRMSAKKWHALQNP